MKEARAQRFPACRVLDDALLDIIQPNALHPRGGAIEITGLLTVKLNEGRAIIEGFLLRLHFAEKIRAAQVNAAIAAAMQLVAGIDADQDRQSVVWGTRVSVSVDLGGRGVIKKK